MQISKLSQNLPSLSTSLEIQNGGKRSSRVLFIHIRKDGIYGRSTWTWRSRKGISRVWGKTISLSENWLLILLQKHIRPYPGYEDDQSQGEVSVFVKSIYHCSPVDHRSFFKKFLELERQMGDEEGAEAVKAKAIEWTQRATTSSWL